MSSKIKILLLILLTLILIFYICKSTECISIEENRENFGPVDANALSLQRSNEAIQSIATIYNTDLARFNNLEIANTIKSDSINSSTITSARGNFTTIAGADNNSALTIGSPVNINNGLCVDNICIDRQNLANLIRDYRLGYPNMYSPAIGASIVYEDLSNVIGSIMRPYGNHQGTGYADNADWAGNRRRVLNIGGSPDGSSGVTITVPAGMTVLWVRALNDRWASFGVNTAESQRRFHAAGFRNITRIRPDGVEDTDTGTLDRWTPIPIHTPNSNGGNISLFGGSNMRVRNPPPMSNFISGIAFSTNPHNHIMCSSATFHFLLNGGEGDVRGTNTSQFNGDVDFIIHANNTVTLRVPNLNSGRPRLLYVLNVGDSAGYTAVTRLTILINNVNVGPFTAAFTNPFSRFYNRPTQQWMRYFAVIIPAAQSSIAPFLDVIIDTRRSNNFSFREMGTHDM